VAASLGSATVIWQTKTGNAEVRKELKEDIGLRVQCRVNGNRKRVERIWDFYTDGVIYGCERYKSRVYERHRRVLPFTEG
jgi:hypothetical protein